MFLDEYIICYRALDPNDMKYKPELQRDTNKMISSFTEIRDGLYKLLRTNSHAVDDLRWILQDWLPCGTIEKNDRFEIITKDMVEDIDDYRRLWRIFSSYCSFFNFKLIERAIDVLEYEDGKILMEVYKKSFANYLKRRVTQCPSGMGMKGNDHVVLLVKLDKAYANCRMEHLKKLGDDICEILLAEKEKMQIDGVETGCICATLHLHRSALPRGFFLTDHQMNALKNLRYMEAKILKVECGSVHYIISKIGTGKFTSDKILLL